MPAANVCNAGGNAHNGRRIAPPGERVKLSGSIPIAADPAAVWGLIVDPAALAGCVPGVRGVREVDERTFDGAITASVGPINGDFSFRATLERTVYPDDLTVRVAGIDSVTKSRLEVVASAALSEPASGGTILTYDATVDVKGRLAILGEMVLRATASLMVGQVTECLRARLESEVAPAVRGEPGP
jgi:carbon monoxide dehydrogenase subunit G